MPCKTVGLDGGFAIACSRTRRKNCCVPGCTNAGTLLCDFPVKGKRSGTCDKAICRRCATKVGPDRDYCPPHARADKEAGEREGEQRTEEKQCQTKMPW